MVTTLSCLIINSGENVCRDSYTWNGSIWVASTLGAGHDANFCPGRILLGVAAPVCILRINEN